MNERIKELAKEARLLTGWPVGEVEFQKFAELIVKECADYVACGEFGDAGLAEELKKHFGVNVPKNSPNVRSNEHARNLPTLRG